MTDRFDYADGNLDDVVVEDVKLFRLEYMSDNGVWLKCYKNYGPDIVIRLSSETRINGFHEFE